MDPRIEKHAKILVNWSTKVQPGDMVTIICNPSGIDLVNAVTKEVGKAGGVPIGLLNAFGIPGISDEIDRAFYEGASDDTIEIFPRHFDALVENSDVIIAIQSPLNIKTLAGIDPNKSLIRAKAIQEIMTKGLSKRWVLTAHPCFSLAQEANMSLGEYQDFVYGATLIDWETESKNLNLMKKHLESHNDIRFVGPETDLWASTEGRIWIADDGEKNMPGGEVLTAPVENTVEGKIYFDIPLLQFGKVIEGVRLTFEKGDVVDFSAEKEEATLKQIIEIDEGSKRLGEMAIGTNRGIEQYTLNILFDEKIGDTIHCALGRAYEFCNGVNESAVHVDIIKSMHKGEIYTGDELIYSKGKYFYEM